MDVLRAISLAFDVPMDDIMQNEPIPSFRELTATEGREAPLSHEEENIIIVVM